MQVRSSSRTASHELPIGRRKTINSERSGSRSTKSYITHALWQELRFDKVLGDIGKASWHQVDELALEQDEIELVLQVNGKLRGHMRAPKTAGREQLEQLALAH